MYMNDNVRSFQQVRSLFLELRLQHDYSWRGVIFLAREPCYYESVQETTRSWRQSEIILGVAHCAPVTLISRLCRVK